MAEEFIGDVRILNAARIETIHLDGDEGEIVVGSALGQAGSLNVRDRSRMSITLDGRANSVWITNDDNMITIQLDGSSGVIVLNGGEQGLHRDVQRVRLDGRTANITLGGNGEAGHVIARNSAGKRTFLADGGGGDIILGGNGSDGGVYVYNKDGKRTMWLDARTADITLGGNGSDGDVKVCNKEGQGTIHLSGDVGEITLGGNGADGDVNVRNKAGKDTIHLDGENGRLWLGGNGARGNMLLRNRDGKDTIHLDGEEGDIILLNADCAEEFDVLDAKEVEPGTVLVLDGQGALRPGTQAYDKRVAGVVSGAEGTKPGIVLGRQLASTDRLPVALVGTAHCKVDAEYGPVEVGDLLTTSPTPGHAMKALDPLQAFGAVIGKALGSLKEGRELVPIIVALQ